MNALIGLIISFCVFSSGMGLGEVGTFGSSPSLAPGHWYSRYVDTKRGVVVSLDTVLVIEAGAEVVKRRVAFEEKLPTDYDPGFLRAGLPELGGGKWYITQPIGAEMHTWECSHAYDAIGLRAVRQRIVLTEPAPAPEVALPVREAPQEAPREIGPKERPSLRHPSKLGQPPIVGESNPSGPLEKPAYEPEALVMRVPEMVNEINWAKGSKSVTPREQSKWVALLRAMNLECSRWQNDLGRQFLTCSEGKCLVRDRGEGSIEVPFQVGMGRIWFLKIEIENLIHRIENGKLDWKEKIGPLLQVQRRVESLQALLEFSRGSSQSNYVETLSEQLEGLHEMSQSWNAFSKTDRRAWVLRWQLLGKDLRAFSERTQQLNRAQPSELSPLLKQAARELEANLDKMGSRPWEKSPEEQYELARQIYFESAAEVREKYSELARFSERLRRTPNDYVNALLIMGAAENMAVYAWTIMEDLAQEDSK